MNPGSPPGSASWRDRRGSIAVMTAVALVPMILILGLVVDEGFWTITSTRLQLAADAAAMADSLAMPTSAFKQQSASTQLTTLQTLATFEANGAAPRLLGTLQTPVITYDGTNYTNVTVTLKTQPLAFFAQALNVTVPTLTATATFSVPPAPGCVTTLGSSASTYGIKVDNAGSIVATGCSIASNSPANPSIYLNSGTIHGSDIAAVGTISLSNSGSNDMKPNPPSSAHTQAPDLYAGKTPPTPGTCVTQQNYTNYGTYDLQPGTYCNGLTIGGNGSTDAFEPGVYIITNGNLTFNNADITKAAGVTFVLEGTTPGSLSWTNNANSVAISPPITGPTAGITFWLVCNNNGQTISLQGGSTLQVSGTIYAPCAAADIGNGSTAVQPPSGAALSFLSYSLYVHGSGSLNTSSGGSSGSSGTMHLTN